MSIISRKGNGANVFESQYREDAPRRRANAHQTVSRFPRETRPRYAVPKSNAFTLYKYGSDALKQKYIFKLVTADYIGAFAITEPDAGSDVMAMSSTAQDEGDHWLLNGSKTWISNADVADVVIYYAYTDKGKGSKGLSAFVIEPKRFNGIKTSVLEKMGSHSSPTGEIFLTNTKVPKENIIRPDLCSKQQFRNH